MLLNSGLTLWAVYYNELDTHIQTSTALLFCVPPDFLIALTLLEYNTSMCFVVTYFTRLSK